MRTIAVLGSILLSALSVLAQLQSTPDTTIRGSERESTIQGCLDISGQNYTLTLASGAVFRLAGNNLASLKSHVRHTMQISGIASPVMNEPGAMSEGVETQPTLWVTSAQEVSGVCSAPSNAIR